MERNHYETAELAGLAGPCAVVGALVDHMSRDALVELEAALYDASSSEFDRLWNADQGDEHADFRAYHRARWQALRDAASYLSGVIQAGTPCTCERCTFEAVA